MVGISSVWLPGDFPGHDEYSLHQLAQRWQVYLHAHGWKEHGRWYVNGAGKTLDDFAFFLLRWRFRDCVLHTNWARPLRARQHGTAYRVRLHDCCIAPPVLKNAERLLEQWGHSPPRQQGSSLFLPPLNPTQAAHISGLLLGHKV